MRERKTINESNVIIKSENAENNFSNQDDVAIDYEEQDIRRQVSEALRFYRERIRRRKCLVPTFSMPC